MNTETKNDSAAKTPWQVAYEAYCDSRNWESVRHEPLPQFEMQDGSIQDSWELAAQAARAPLQAELDLKTKQLTEAVKAGLDTACKLETYRQELDAEKETSRVLRANLEAVAKDSCAHIARLEAAVHLEKSKAEKATDQALGWQKESAKDRARIAELETDLSTKNALLKASTESNNQLMDRFEASEKAVAAMREALEYSCMTWSHITQSYACGKCHNELTEGHKPGCRIGQALSQDAGKGYVALIEVEPLVEVLTRIANYPIHSEPMGGAYDMRDKAETALKTWNEKHGGEA